MRILSLDWCYKTVCTAVKNRCQSRNTHLVRRRYWLHVAKLAPHCSEAEIQRWPLGDSEPLSHNIQNIQNWEWDQQWHFHRFPDLETCCNLWPQVSSECLFGPLFCWQQSVVSSTKWDFWQIIWLFDLDVFASAQLQQASVIQSSEQRMWPRSIPWHIPAFKGLHCRTTSQPRYLGCSHCKKDQPKKFLNMSCLTFLHGLQSMRSRISSKFHHPSISQPCLWAFNTIHLPSGNFTFMAIDTCHSEWKTHYNCPFSIAMFNYQMVWTSIYLISVTIRMIILLTMIMDIVLMDHDQYHQELLSYDDGDSWSSTSSSPASSSGPRANSHYQIG